MAQCDKGVYIKGAGSSKNDGNGRLWERFEMKDINERLELIYQHLRDIGNNYDRAPPDYSVQVTEIRQIFVEHKSEVQKATSNWELRLNERTKQMNHLNDVIKQKKC
eukprot:338636_1